MEVFADFYVSGNGLSITLCPETEIEKAVLKGLQKHGKLELVHPGRCQASNPAVALVWEFDKE